MNEHKSCYLTPPRIALILRHLCDTEAIKVAYKTSTLSVKLLFLLCEN